jgi:hypothetical protein
VLVDEHFKSFSQSCLSPVPFGKWAHYLGSINNEHGRDALGLQEFAYKFVNQTCG